MTRLARRGKPANVLIKVQVGGTSVEMLIDLGGRFNILDDNIEDIVSANKTNKHDQTVQERYFLTEQRTH